MARGRSGLRPAPLKNNLLELEITVGRYSGIKLEQDFRAEMLLTTGRLEAPLEHISSSNPVRSSCTGREGRTRQPPSQSVQKIPATLLSNAIEESSMNFTGGSP